MSWETQAWAAKQRPGSASAKLVLLGLASCADANHCAWPSVQWLCDFSDLNRKTVIAALQRLERGMFPMIEDSGARRGRTSQVKVYRLAALDVTNNAAPVRSDPAGESVPKPEPSQKRNSSGSGFKASQKRDTEPSREPFNPSPPDGGDRPLGKNGKEEAAPRNHSGRAKRLGSRLPPDWSLPPLADLPPLAAKLVGDWPSGAYEAVGEAFRLHWLAETRSIGCKADWPATLGKWVINEHPKVMGAAARGISYTAAAPARPAIASAAPPPPVKAKAREDARSAALHAALAKAVGEATHGHWLGGAALLVADDGALDVVLPSEFARTWVAANLEPQLRAAALSAVGGGGGAIRFRVGKISDGRAQ
jgi:hypothetical protein